MDLLTPELRAALVANAQATKEAQRTDARAPDPAPVVKFFSPISAAMWLATELEPDGDTLFGLADLGFGCPELGRFSLGELAGVRLPFDLRIERDLNFSSDVPLSLWTEVARRTGSIMGAAQALRIARERLSKKLPSGSPDG